MPLTLLKTWHYISRLLLTYFFLTVESDNYVSDIRTPLLLNISDSSAH